MWFATVCPSARMRYTNHGWSKAFFPTRKKLAVTPRSRRISSKRAVPGAGPSSYVSATQFVHLPYLLYCASTVSTLVCALAGVAKVVAASAAALTIAKNRFIDSPSFVVPGARYRICSATTPTPNHTYILMNSHSCRHPIRLHLSSFLAGLGLRVNLMWC